MTRFLRLFAFTLFSFLFWGALAWVGLGYRVARGYVYRPSPFTPMRETPGDYGVVYRSVVFTTEDGLRLAGWYTPPPVGESAVLLLAHGQGGHRMARVHAEAARYTGLGVLSWDFRGHGESQGAMRTFGYYEARDVRAAARFALAQPRVARVLAWGTSMGAAATLWAAARDPQGDLLHMVLADSPYADLVAIEGNLIRLPGLPPVVRFFAARMTGLHPSQMRPVDVVHRIAPRPLVLLHGEEDAVIPVEHAYQLYEAARPPKLLWVWQGMGHSQAVFAEGETYWACLARVMHSFLETGSIPQGDYRTRPPSRPSFCVYP